MRELYLKSGNRCAFPECEKILFNKSGNFVGQICHIEAAEQGGERFNPDQTNEDRRRPANLLLLCYDHHVETNDVDKYPVASMQRIKEEHERKFSDVIGTMLLTVSDHTKLTKPSLPQSLRMLSSVLGWEHGDEELAEEVAELQEMVKRLTRVPRPSRELLLILIERGRKASFGSYLAAEMPEIQQATELSFREMRGLFSVLDSHGLVFDDGKTDFGVESVGISNLKSGWHVWKDIRKFCKRQEVPLERIVLELDFSVLD